jgi:hypothetical protein
VSESSPEPTARWQAPPWATDSRGDDGDVRHSVGRDVPVNNDMGEAIDVRVEVVQVDRLDFVGGVVRVERDPFEVVRDHLQFTLEQAHTAVDALTELLDIVEGHP